MGEQGNINVMSYKSCYLSNNYNIKANNHELFADANINVNMSNSNNYNLMMRADSASSSNLIDIIELEGIINSELKLEQSSQCPVLTVVRNINDNINDINCINDINYNSLSTTPAIITCLNDATLDELLASAMLNDYASNNDVLNDKHNNCYYYDVNSPDHLSLSADVINTSSDGYGELQYSPASNISSCCTINSDNNTIANDNHSCSPISSTTNYEAELQQSGGNTIHEQVFHASRSSQDYLEGSRGIRNHVEASNRVDFPTLSEAKLPQLVSNNNISCSIPAKYDVLQPNLVCTTKSSSSMLHFKSTTNPGVTNISPAYTPSPSPSPPPPLPLPPPSSASSKEQMYRMAAMRPLNEDGIVDDEGCGIIINNGMNAHKPIKRKNVRISSDPQSVAARQRRERISERIRTLQRLVPCTNKMDTASMLDEAIQYLKYLQKEVKCAKMRIRSANGIINTSSSSTTSSLYNKAYVNHHHHHQYATSCFATRVLQY